MGWWVEEYGMAQVSMNLDDYTVTPPHAAYEACLESARAIRVGLAGSEVVGLVPLQALLAAAEHYSAAEGLLVVDERQKVRLAVDRLGLGSVSPFVPEKRVIEYMVAEQGAEALAGRTVRGFVELLGSRAPAPGGGSASALMAAMGAALGAMVGWMTYGKRKFEDRDAAVRAALPPLHRAMTELIPMIDEDTAAFNDYMAALGLPRETEALAAAREAAMQDGLRKAVAVPLKAMRIADGCWDPLLEMAKHGNPASRSDLEVGAKALEAGIWGAGRNVAINLPQIADQGFRERTQSEADGLAARAARRLAEVLAAASA
jgi:glutamate formiminotransferase/formiminotetrahydrofolate cyclodeaminase